MFQRLIELRSSVVRELAKWVGKQVIVEGDTSSLDFNEKRVHGHPRWKGMTPVTLRSVNGFWTTFADDNKKVSSEPIEKLILSWHEPNKCLKVLVKA
jgi:hypothetical protein